MSCVFSLYYMSVSPANTKSDEPVQSIHKTDKNLQMKLLGNKSVENQFVF